MLLLAIAACTMPAAPDLPRAPVRAAVPRAGVGKVHRVDCAGAGDYATIAEGIAAADRGDTIELAPCTYWGAVDLAGKAVHLVGTDGAAATIIRAAPGAFALRVTQGEDVRAVIEGVTFEGGGGPDAPVVEVDFAALTLRDVVVRGGDGRDVVYARSGHLALDRVEFTGNRATGVGVYTRRGEAVLKDVRFDCGGTVPVGARIEHGMLFVDGTTFTCLGATSLYVENSPARVQRSRLDGRPVFTNEALGEGVIVEGTVIREGLTAEVAEVTLRNTVVSGGPIHADGARVVVDSSVVRDAPCALEGTDSTVTWTYDVLWALDAHVCAGEDPVGTGGAVEVDPLHVDPAGGDWRVQTGSPCIDAGDPDGEYTDPDGTRNDVGAYGGKKSLGGGW